LTLLQAVGRTFPPIRRLYDQRNELLIQQAVLLAERDALVSDRDKLAAKANGFDAESAALGIAQAEHRLIVTDYAYYPSERGIDGSAGAERIIKRLTAEETRYAAALQGIARHAEALSAIPQQQADPQSPFWANGWFPPSDAASLYGLIAEQRPKRYIEVGSGNSTLFARQAIRDLGLTTQITSIDPHPRADIDQLCDNVVRRPMEDLPRDFWKSIGAGDILFIDNSHRAFPNSDVTVFFTEVMPALNPGVIWGLHDIYLPWDYPDPWSDRYYNEQYLLQAYLLGGAGDDEILLPMKWAMHQPALRAILEPLWASHASLRKLATHCGCFWMQRRGG
jgi:hypothetical protein